MKKLISFVLIALLSGCSNLAVKTGDDVPRAAAKTGTRMVLFPLTLGLSEAVIKQSEASRLMSEGNQKEAKEKHEAAKTYIKRWGIVMGTLVTLGAVAGAVAKNNSGSTRRRTYVIHDDEPLRIYRTTTIGNSTYYHTNKGTYRVYNIGNATYVDSMD